jgi:hypothetical protein
MAAALLFVTAGHSLAGEVPKKVADEVARADLILRYDAKDNGEWTARTMRRSAHVQKKDLEYYQLRFLSLFKPGRTVSTADCKSFYVLFYVTSENSSSSCVILARDGKIQFDSSGRADQIRQEDFDRHVEEHYKVSESREAGNN